MIYINNGYVPNIVPISKINIDITQKKIYKSILGISSKILDPFDERGKVQMYPSQLSTQYEELIVDKKNEPILTDN